jgi:hypothetical protein
MHSPKVIIHRLDAPWQRPVRRPVRRGLLTCAAAVAGFAALIGTLTAADDAGTAPPAAAQRSSLTHIQTSPNSILP